jgi:hypothetical protein
MVTGVLQGGRMGRLINNPLPLMFPVFPFTRRGRPLRLFQCTSIRNSTGIRIPVRWFSSIGSPLEQARLSHKGYPVSAIVARRNSEEETPRKFRNRRHCLNRRPLLTLRV